MLVSELGRDVFELGAWLVDCVAVASVGGSLYVFARSTRVGVAVRFAIVGVV